MFYIYAYSASSFNLPMPQKGRIKFSKRLSIKGAYRQAIGKCLGNISCLKSTTATVYLNAH